jgi:hypothetical protein
MLLPHRRKNRDGLSFVPEDRTASPLGGFGTLANVEFETAAML